MLEQNLESTPRILHEWAENEKLLVAQSKRECDDAIEKGEQQLQELKSRKADLSVTMGERQSMRERAQRAIQAEETDICKVQTEIDKCEKIIARLKSRQLMHNNTLMNFKEGIMSSIRISVYDTGFLETAKNAEARQFAVDELMKGINLYRKLGLVIDKNQGT
jgi:hypothetical protein